MADTFDYSGLASTAQSLIERFGRLAQVTLFQTAEDPDEPWAPGSQSQTTTDMPTVFTKISETYVDGELVQHGDQWALVSSKVLLDVNLKGIITDNGEVWKIVRIKPIKPGPVSLIYKIQVRQ